jgi:flagellar hook-length control protein FliK
MNPGVLTNTLVSNVGAGLTPSKSAPARNTRPLTRTSVDEPRSANTPETTTSGNTLSITQNEHIKKPPQEFRYSFRKKTMAEGRQKGQSNIRTKGQSPASDKAVQPAIVHSWLALFPLVEHGEKGVAREIGPKAGYQLAQLLASLRTNKFPPGTGPTAKPVAKEPLLTVDKGRLGLKAVLPEFSGGMLVSGTQPAERKNAGKIRVSGKTLIITKGLIKQQGGKELDHEALTDDSKTSQIGEKPATAGETTVSGSQKTSVLAAAGSKTPVAGEETAITDGQAIVGGQKTLVSNNDFPAVQDKSAAPRQKVQVDPEKSALIAEKPEQGSRSFATSVENRNVFNSETNKADTENKDVFNSETGKTDTPRRQHPGTPGFSGLMDGSSKEQADNTIGKSLLQNLNPAQVQISTGQTKDRSSLTSSNGSNSNFGQVLSNNAQNPVVEQTSPFSPAAKAANNASPGNASTSLGEQLQESIHSSLSQGDQQLTIRLNPPELGRVFIKFQEQGNQITGLLEVDKAQTRYEIEQALPQIIRNLAECGVQIKRLEVVLTSQQEQQAFKDPSLAAEQDGWSGQKADSEGNNHSHDTFGDNEWLTDDPNYSGFSETQEMLIADEFIDMLV